MKRCLGTPSSRTGRSGAQRWTYRGKLALELRFTGGRVSGFTLLGRGLSSTPDRAAVGGSLQSFRRALGSLLRDGPHGYRGVVAVGTRRFADVRLTVKGGRVSRVRVAVKPLSALDGAGRRLLGKTR